MVHARVTVTTGFGFGTLLKNIIFCRLHYIISIQKLAMLIFFIQTKTSEYSSDIERNE